MFLSVSRRTDIPAYYSEWFFNRIDEGFCYTQNPFNKNQISKIIINPDVIDGIVFWTKNPKPMISNLSLLKDYPYYFQFSITAYEKNLEKNLPSKNSIINTFKELSELIGKERVIWRYDPILITPIYTFQKHYIHFEILAKLLKDYTNKVIFSYVDFYTKIKKNLKELQVQELNCLQKEEIAKNLSDIAKTYGLQIESCCEDINLEKYGINHAHCIDEKLFEKIANRKFSIKKDSFQRKECGCVQSQDIGMYNTCNNHCLYCYATYNKESTQKNILQHDKNSPLLIGSVPENIKILEKKVVLHTIKENQLSLFNNSKF